MPPMHSPHPDCHAVAAAAQAPTPSAPVRLGRAIRGCMAAAAQRLVPAIDGLGDGDRIAGREDDGMSIRSS